MLLVLRGFQPRLEILYELVSSQQTRRNVAMPGADVTIKTRDGNCPASVFTPATGKSPKVDDAWMLRLKGEVLLVGDRSATPGAEQCFRKELEVARAQEAKCWELRTSVSLARLLRDTNRSDQARTTFDLQLVH
jgi:hypothetical protein